MNISATTDLARAESNWWRRRSLKLRIAFWFTVIAGGLMLCLLPLVYSLIHRRLHVEMDRQLAIDWALVEAHLEPDGAGGVEWRRGSPATPMSPGYAETWFDAWSNQEMLLSHWPPKGVQVVDPPQPVGHSLASYYNLWIAPDFPARTFQKSTSIRGIPVVLRVFRDESGIRSTLREILVGLALGLPIAVLLAAAGGYFMADRTLKPISEMVDQARLITSDSLGRRLPVPNPHDELGQMATVFNDTLHRLEASFDALKRFTADASHELRTPLSALSSVGEISLRETQDVDTLRETIGSMLEEAERLNDLVDTLLMLARVESGRIQLDIKNLSLNDLVIEVADSLEVLVAEKNQRVEISTTSSIRVEADRVLLRQVLMNILHNAIRYSPPNATVRVNCSSQQDQAVVEICDEGPGIAVEEQARVFERFYRADKARSRSDGGAGLGLSLAKMFVEQNGGTIHFTSEPGRGCCFRILLPLADPAAS